MFATFHNKNNIHVLEILENIVNYKQKFQPSLPSDLIFLNIYFLDTIDRIFMITISISS